MGNGVILTASRRASFVGISRYFAIALVTGSFLATPAAYSAHASLDDHWEALGYKFDRIERKKQLSTAECNKSERNLLACIQAVNSILNYGPTTLRLVPEAYRAQNPEYAPPQVAFGLASIVEAPKSSAKNMGQLILESRKIKTAIHNGWKEALKSIQADQSLKIDLDAIVAFLKQESYFAANESKIVGAVTNAFYTILHDPHTMVLPTPAKKQMTEAAESVVGIGASMQPIEREGKKLPMIHRVLEDSPAHKGGLLPKDVLTEVDGVSIAGQPLEEVVSKIHGAEGTQVKLSLIRGDVPMELLLTRAKLENRNVRPKMVGDARDIGYVSLENFMEMNPRTGEALPCTDLKAALSDLEGKGAKSLILDLRDNGGGMIGEAECIANLFLDLKPGEPIVATKSFLKDEESFVLPEGLPARIHTKLPMVVLVNASSASASEIVAGALQDYERAFLIGERTYGKGSMQSFRRLGSKGELQLKETTGRFYLPSGRTNQIETVHPDIERFTVPNPSEEDKAALREGDEYMALPPMGPTWQQTRPDTVAKLEGCMKSNGTAEKDYTANLTSALGSDFQLYSAIDAANCIVSNNLWDISLKRPTYGPPAWIAEQRAKEFFNKNVLPILEKVF